MSEIIKYAPYFFLSFIYLYTIQCYFQTFFSEKKEYINKILYLLVLCVFYICSTVTTIYKNDQLNLFTNITFMVAITLFYKTNILQRLVSIVILYIIAMASEIITNFAALQILQISAAEIKNNSNVIFIMMAISKLIFWVIIKLFCPFLFYIQKQKKLKLPKSYWLLLLVPISSIMIIYFFYAIQIQTKNQIVAPIIITLILGINFLVFYLYDRLLKNFDAETENRMLKKQIAMYNQSYSEIESSQREIRTLIHNYENKVLGLRGIIDQNNTDMDQIKKEINEILGEEFNRPTVCCGIPCLDIIINHKAAYANEYGIKIKTKIELPDDTFFPNNDIGVILGNALDNAIEACKEVQIAKKEIKIMLKNDRDCLIIFVDNPYEGEINFDEYGNPLSKRDKKSHGYGFKSIRSIVDKQGGCIFFQTENKIFKLNIILFEFSEKYANKELASIQ